MVDDDGRPFLSTSKTMDALSFVGLPPPVWRIGKSAGVRQLPVHRPGHLDDHFAFKMEQPPAENEKATSTIRAVKHDTISSASG